MTSLVMMSVMLAALIRLKLDNNYHHHYNYKGIMIIHVLTAVIVIGIKRMW